MGLVTRSQITTGQTAIEHSHDSRGTHYGEDAAGIYSHGPDGDHFLNPVLEHLLRSTITSESRVVDMGCGPANEAVRTAEFSARNVFAIDYQREMQEKGMDKVRSKGLQACIKIECGDASDLSPYSDIEGSAIEERDLALSILVGCNLPNGTFQRYYGEMGRVLRSGGKAIVVLPTSLDRTFTKGDITADEANAEVDATLATLPRNPSEETIRRALAGFDQINSATFVINDEGYLERVRDCAQLHEGQEVWRKLPNGLVIPNFYWSQSAYHELFSQHHLRIPPAAIAPKFSDEEQRRAYNDHADDAHRLGSTYVTDAIFTTYVLVKE